MKETTDDVHTRQPTFLTNSCLLSLFRTSLCNYLPLYIYTYLPVLINKNNKIYILGLKVTKWRKNIRQPASNVIQFFFIFTFKLLQPPAHQLVGGDFSSLFFYLITTLRCRLMVEAVRDGLPI